MNKNGLNACQCPPGTYGIRCETVCPTNLYGPHCNVSCVINETNSRWTCDSNGNKVCKTNWLGANCNAKAMSPVVDPECPNNLLNNGGCYNGGTCFNKGCICAAGFTGKILHFLFKIFSFYINLLFYQTHIVKPKLTTA